MGQKIIIYTSPTCSWCHKAMELFASKGLSVEQIDVTKNIAEAGRVFQKFGKISPLPIIQIGDQVLFGYSKKKILDALG